MYLCDSSEAFFLLYYIAVLFFIFWKETLCPGEINEACDTQKENKLLMSRKAEICKILKEPPQLSEAANDYQIKRLMSQAAKGFS